MGEAIYALFRSTSLVILSGLVVQQLLSRFRRLPPWQHQLACALVLLQGWTFFQATVYLPSSGVPIEHAAADKLVFEQSGSRSDASDNSSLEHKYVAPSGGFVALALPVFFIWLFGAAVTVALGIGRYLLFLRRFPDGSTFIEDHWTIEWNKALSESGLSKNIQFRIADAAGPFACFLPSGYWVVVPAGLWGEMTSMQRMTVLRHEIAHISRGDLWLLLAVRVLCLPQWFNPIAWLIVRTFDNAVEWACDDCVLRKASEAERIHYPSVLLRIADYSIRQYSCSLAMQGGILSQRIRRLLQGRVKEKTMFRSLLLPGTLLVVTFFQAFRFEYAVADETGGKVKSAAHIPVFPKVTAATDVSEGGPSIILVLEGEAARAFLNAQSTTQSATSGEEVRVQISMVASVIQVLPGEKVRIRSSGRRGVTKGSARMVVVTATVATNMLELQSTRVASAVYSSPAGLTSGEAPVIATEVLNQVRVVLSDLSDVTIETWVLEDKIGDTRPTSASTPGTHKIPGPSGNSLKN